MTESGYLPGIEQWAARLGAQPHHMRHWGLSREASVPGLRFTVTFTEHCGKEWPANASKVILHKAHTILTSNGMAAGDQQTIDDLLARHPTSKHLPSTFPKPEIPDQQQPFGLSAQHFMKALQSLKPLKARDQWGWRLREHLMPLLLHDKCGELFVALILVPIANGHLQFFDCQQSAGGKLFALSKAPKKGVWLIVVTDALRALVGKVLFSQEGYPQKLPDYFTQAHQQAFQMGVGMRSGATIMQHLIWLLLEAPVAPNCPVEDSSAVVGVDVKNGFQKLKRDCIFATICNQQG